MNKGLFRYIADSPTAFHAVRTTAQMLEKENFRRLEETELWKLQEGGCYYVTRNGSSLIAFRIPRKDFAGFMMSAAHADSPCFKIKENAERIHDGYVSLSAEGYGSMICSSWMDRPLSIAGRVMLRTENGAEMRLVDLRDPVTVIPNVAIHMNRDMNKGTAYDASKDMQPLLRDEKGESAAPLKKVIAGSLQTEEDAILAMDLFVYNPEEGREWGDYISAPRLDDLQCAYACLKGFIKAKPSDSVPVFCLFDNEEVGSCTKQGAESTFLPDVLGRIAAACGADAQELARKIANSFMISADNAHAAHPNHGEYCDPNQTVRMNGGIVMKLNANQKYTTDAVSASLLRMICDREAIPYQYYANRADIPGGSTLGNISASKVSVDTVDVGLAQLSMHSAYETAGNKDTEYLEKMVRIYYGKTLRKHDGTYELR